MLRRSSVATVAAIVSLLGMYVSLHGSPTASPPQPRVRVIQYAPNLSIRDRLLPDDDIVEIERDLDVVDIEPEPTVQWVIDYAIETAEFVAVVDVRDVTALLVDDGKWTHTKLTGVPRDVLKASVTAKVSRAKRIEVQAPGGELRIGKVLVRTRDSIRFPANRRYLMFLKFVREWHTLAATGAPFLIENGRLESLTPDGSFFGKMNGVRLSEIQNRVHQVSKQP